MKKFKILPTLLCASKAGDRKFNGGLLGASLSIAITELSSESCSPILVLVPNAQTAVRLQLEISQLTSEPVSLFPHWGTLPYDHFSPHQEVISDRIACLYRLSSRKKGVLITSISTLLQRQAPKEFLLKNTIIVEKGDSLSLEKLRGQLKELGYRHTSQVFQPGEYAIRGSIIDLFPTGERSPYRLNFLDQEVNSIRTFDPDSQRSTKKASLIQLMPAHEFPTSQAGIAGFCSRFRKQFSAHRNPESLYVQASKGIWPSGIEYWQPLFFEKTETLFDYLPTNTKVFLVGDIEPTIDSCLQDIAHRYQQQNVNPLRPLLTPESLWLGKDELFAFLKAYPVTYFSHDILKVRAGRTNIDIIELPDIEVKCGNKEPLIDLQRFLETFPGKVIFSVESEGRCEAITDLLDPLKIKISKSSSIQEACQGAGRFTLIISHAELGFIFPSASFALLCEEDILGCRRPHRKVGDQSVSGNSVLRNLAELKEGHLVVHAEHGVGRYVGLKTLEASGIKAEYVALEYLNSTRLYVPVSSLNLVSRYHGSPGENVLLGKLASDNWIRTRRRAAEKIRDVAAELLDIYAKRALRPGFQFHLDREQYNIFRSSFPFEETDDQADVINAVLLDMCQPKSMDRLVCGDVGFGKTEVAMRAAFVCTNNGKQVIVLVPTTLLAQQHFKNFKDRFAGLPVRIEVLSRFKTLKEQKKITKDAADGKVDVLVGTHKLFFSSAIRFEKLGLLIIDEEHRFGVRQKEKIKDMRVNVDVLTLTATPIPRTLNMAMSGVRDLSIIATPPSRRLAVKTFVSPFENNVIREAVLREIARGGQIYYLHNQVKTIERAAKKLGELVPEARIKVAHGKMRERELERITNDFYHQRFNLLVCTTIIETGIDIPTANTIIIDRADKFGLSQLHQLRGRVGRSYHQAYAYLLTPPPESLTQDAVKRLDALASLEDLGAGFALATLDLDIRGAGELLGDDQSGQIQSVGLTLYMEMLSRAVDELKSGREPTLDTLLGGKTEIELRLPTLLPDDFIPDVSTRLSIYRRISSIESDDEINQLKYEIMDRFGRLPIATLNLLDITRLRLKAASLRVRKLEANSKGGYIEFYPDTCITPEAVINFLESNPGQFSLEGATKIKFSLPLLEPANRIKFIAKILGEFERDE